MKTGNLTKENLKLGFKIIEEIGNCVINPFIINQITFNDLFGKKKKYKFDCPRFRNRI